MLSLRPFAPVALFLLLLVGSTQATATGPDPLLPKVALQRLTRAANLQPAQLPAVRKATNRYAKALARLNRKKFTSTAEVSGAYTAVEYTYSRALQQVLSPAQMAVYEQLDLTSPLVELP